MFCDQFYIVALLDLLRYGRSTYSSSSLTEIFAAAQIENLKTSTAELKIGFIEIIFTISLI